MGSPGIGRTHAQFRVALKHGFYPLARKLAESLPHVDLIDLLRLTVLAAQENRDDFEILARKWITQGIEDGELTIHDLSWVVPWLSEIGSGDQRRGRALIGRMLRRRTRAGLRNDKSPPLPRKEDDGL